MYHIAGYFCGGNNNSWINPKRVLTIQMVFKTLKPLNKNSTKITRNTVHTLLSYDKKETANTPQKQEREEINILSPSLSLSQGTTTLEGHWLPLRSLMLLPSTRSSYVICNYNSSVKPPPHPLFKHERERQ